MDTTVGAKHLVDESAGGYNTYKTLAGCNKPGDQEQALSFVHCLLHLYNYNAFN